jgi:hypothetical protein
MKRILLVAGFMALLAVGPGLAQGVTVTRDDLSRYEPGPYPIDSSWETNPFYAALIEGKTLKAQEILQDTPARDREELVNKRLPNGRRPMHLAANHGNTELCLLLIKFGAEVNQPDNFGATPLHLAAANNHTECLFTLGLKGGKINLQDSHGRTPLHRAVEAANLQATEALLRLGAKRTLTDDSGKTPVEYASMEEIRELFERGSLAKKAPGSGNPELLWEKYRDDGRLYDSDREEIPAILDDPNLSNKLKWQRLAHILGRRGISISLEEPAVEADQGEDPGALFEKIQDDFRLYGSDKEKIQKILDDSTFSAELKRNMIQEVMKKRGIPLN